MWLTLYSIAYALIFPFLKRKLKKASAQVAPSENRWLEYEGHVELPVQKRIWVHCVSMGESLAAIGLIKALRKKLDDDFDILITTTTATGSAEIKKAFGEQFGKGISHCYAPYDFKKTVGRFLLNTKPRLLLVMETELWPNWLDKCAVQGIPVLLLNARMSEKSAAGYARFPALAKFIFSSPRKIAAQYQSDANRFIQLGAPIDNVATVGNLKFDITIAEDEIIKGNEIRKSIGARPAWIAASIHPGEDEIVFNAHRRILESNPDALLVVVPRHPKRFDEMAQNAVDSGFNVARRSREEPVSENTQVYLADTMGELKPLYQASDYVFVGGSLIRHGGQNMLEPAMLGKPLMMGDSRYNFSDICQQLQSAGGLQRVDDDKDIASQVCLWLSNADAALEVGEQARRVVMANQGALDKTVQLVLEYCSF